MTFETFLLLFAVLAIATSAFTEGVKKFLDSMNRKYASNVVVLCVSVVIGGVGTIVFYLWNDYAWTSLNIICIFIMICANWLGAMLGYDKTKQTIMQIAAIIGRR